jgi:hypothetical protein
VLVEAVIAIPNLASIVPASEGFEALSVRRGSVAIKLTAPPSLQWQMGVWRFRPGCARERFHAPLVFFTS